MDLPAADGKVLTAAGDGTVILRDRGAAGRRGQWAFVARGGCPAYPEVELDVSGAPASAARRGARCAGWSTPTCT